MSRREVAGSDRERRQGEERGRGEGKRKEGEERVRREGEERVRREGGLMAVVMLSWPWAQSGTLCRKTQSGNLGLFYLNCAFALRNTEIPETKEALRKVQTWDPGFPFREYKVPPARKP